jgi:hypothetical protein
MRETEKRLRREIWSIESTLNCMIMEQPEAERLKVELETYKRRLKMLKIGELY